MLQLFGLVLPPAPHPVDAELADALTRRMAASAQALEGRAPAPLAAGMREEAQRYLRARSAEELCLAPAVGRGCDRLAWAIMSRTMDVPPAVRSGGATLVA
jgi:hypothetical protein